MDMSIETYKNFIEQHCKDMSHNPTIPKKIKKTLKAIKKQLNKLDPETFSFLINMNYHYMLSSAMDDLNSIMNELRNGTIDDDMMEDEEIVPNNGFIHRPKMKFRVIDDSEFSIGKNNGFVFPPELKNIQWAMKGPMELTIASNGTMWMNNELWKYLVEMVQVETFGNVPKIFQSSKPPSEIPVNIGYNKNYLLISLTSKLSRCMEVTFIENIDSYGEPYGTVDDNTCTKFQIETSFNIKGKYVFSPTNIFGLLYGKKI